MAFAALRSWLLRGPQDTRQHLAPDPEPPPADPPLVGAGRDPLWPASRLAVAEQLWGSGYLSPGAGSELLRFASPLGLSASSSLLLLGAGAGGPPQTLATELGVWVAAMEADPELAELAARRVQRAGAAQAKRASVVAWDPAAPRFGERRFHHALALEAIGHRDPAPVLAGLAAALKAHGQVVLVETVAPVPLNAADPATAAWIRLEGRGPRLADPEALTRGLTRLGFGVRAVDDLSSRHMRLAIMGWRHFVRVMAREQPPQSRAGHDRAAAVVAEAELWTRRIRLMHSGQIRLMRWHAVGPSGPRPEGAGA